MSSISIHIQGDRLIFGKWDLPVLGFAKSYKILRSSSVAIFARTNLGSKIEIKLEMMCSTAENIRELVLKLKLINLSENRSSYDEEAYGIYKNPWYQIYSDKIEKIHFKPQEGELARTVSSPGGKRFLVYQKNDLYDESPLLRDFFGTLKRDACADLMTFYSKILGCFEGELRQQVNEFYGFLEKASVEEGYFTGEEADYISMIDSSVQAQVEWLPESIRSLLILTCDEPKKEGG